jgi:hypothetical protein
MLKQPILVMALFLFASQVAPAQQPSAGEPSPDILSVRGRVALVHEITQKRLDTLLPRMMRETGLDMWIITGNEDNHDPIFLTMTPYKGWSPITQILVLYDRGPGMGVERR